MNLRAVVEAQIAAAPLAAMTGRSLCFKNAMRDISLRMSSARSMHNARRSAPSNGRSIRPRLRSSFLRSRQHYSNKKNSPVKIRRAVFEKAAIAPDSIKWIWFEGGRRIIAVDAPRGGIDYWHYNTNLRPISLLNHMNIMDLIRIPVFIVPAQPFIDFFNSQQSIIT